MKSRILPILLLSLLCVASAVAQKVNVDWDRTENFSNFHTYAWQKSPHPAKGLWDQRIIDGIDKQLQSKGLRKVDSESGYVGGLQQQHQGPEAGGRHRLQHGTGLGLGIRMGHPNYDDLQHLRYQGRVPWS